MTEPKLPSPEEYIQQWEGMQEEFIREGTEFRLMTPDLKPTQKGHTAEHPTQRKASHAYSHHGDPPAARNFGCFYL